MSQSSPSSRQVWDPLIRIGHWTLVIAFFTAYLSGDDAFTLHKWAGYWVAGYVLFRIVWGIIGPRHARFANFVRGPRAVLGYLMGLATGKAADHTGHNPAGGAMVVALLLSLMITTSSGMALYAIEDGRGPLAGLLAQQAITPIVSLRGEDDEEHENGESLAGESLEGVHKASVYLTLTLIGLHLAGVVASSIAHKENLARAMVTGRKRVPEADR